MMLRCPYDDRRQRRLRPDTQKNKVMRHLQMMLRRPLTTKEWQQATWTSISSYAKTGEICEQQWLYSDERNALRRERDTTT